MSGFEFETIHTLDARSHLFLQVTAKHLQLSDEMVFKVIRALYLHTVQILASKQVDYRNLRRALIPSTNRQERALVFDYTKFKVSMYGREVIHTLLPVLHPESTHSVLCGDWLHSGVFAEWLAMSPAAQGTVDRDRADVPYSSVYFAYLNNLTDAGAVAIDRAFQGHPAYLGCLDLTRATPLKGYLSTCLVRDFIKHRRIIIKGHEDDRDPAEDYNLSLFDFERFGLKIRSLPLTHYGVLLSYKIERPAMPKELDRRFSLNAISTEPRLFDDFEVVLEEPKLQYLRKEKSGSLKRAGLESMTAENIAAQIRSKVTASYIYSLARSANGDTLKFDVLVESPTGTRGQCSLEYRPGDRTLRVITFF